MKTLKRIAAAGLGVSMLAALSGCSFNKGDKEFTPRLDKDKKVTITTTGFFSNFEALDAVTVDFNRYYPNVDFNYEQTSTDNFESYIESNNTIDIFMTSDDLYTRYSDTLDKVCADLSKEDIDLSDIDEKMLKGFTKNDKLIAAPMGQNMYGLIVNVSLLEKEGLSVPTNYEEFTGVLKALKDKGYTPIQGPESKIYAELTESMLYDMLLSDEALLTDVLAGRESAADALLPVTDVLDNMMSNGYIDGEVNAQYPDDNYDQAILRFFEGEVPFWVCNTEKVSGMKKRESKSEAFQAAPFEYTYIFAPLGDKGAYAYSEPWFGFSLNKQAANYDYALEFLRFLVTKDELNKLADTKGVPSAAVEKSDIAVYKNVVKPEKIELSLTNNGKITPAVVSAWYSVATQYANGKLGSAKEALNTFIKLCSGQGE